MISYIPIIEERIFHPGKSLAHQILFIQTVEQINNFMK